MLKNLALAVSLASTLAFVAALLVAPSIVGWWSTSAGPSAFDCTPHVTWALERTRISILVVGGLGGLAGLALGVALHLRAKKKHAASSAAAPDQTASA